MKKTLLILCLMCAEANATAPVVLPRLDPLMTVVNLTEEKDTFQNRMNVISKETGVKIKVDSARLAMHGITKNQITVVKPDMTNKTAIELIVSLCKSIENKPDTVLVQREEDGSLTITAK